MKGKGIGILVVALATFFMLAGSALALPSVEWVKINDNKFKDGDNLVVERGDELEVEVKFQSSSDVDDVEASIDMLGYEYNDFDKISDSIATFDLDANKTTYKTLSITLPEDMEKDEEYDLRLRMGSRTGPSEENRYRLTVDGPRHSVALEDLILSPEGEVKSGRALLGTVRMENMGDKDEEDLKVKISIPELGVSASDYVDELEKGEELSSEELYLRLPDCTEPGVYRVKADVSYDNGYEKVSTESTVRVVADESCTTSEEDDEKEDKEKTVLSVGTTKRTVTIGEGGVVYPVTITNAGSQSKTYSLSVDGVQGWATSRITPSNTLVLEEGQTRTAYVYITATQDASTGQHMFSVTVESDGKTLKEMAMKSMVEAGEGDGEQQTDWSTLKNGLQIGLIVLVVLLVLLGLIVGFNKLKGGRDEEDQAYY